VKHKLTTTPEQSSENASIPSNQRFHLRFRFTIALLLKRIPLRRLVMVNIA
jgi:hypothetical protein